MIVAGPDGFQKSQHRKFNSRSTELTPGHDFAMMRAAPTLRIALGSQRTAAPAR